MEKEDKFLLSLAEDKMRQRDLKNIPANTCFLDLRQQSLLKSHLGGLPGSDFVLYGGYTDAERCICAFLPEYLSAEDYYGISCIRVITSSSLPKPLTHRDYLGSLMAMGIKRETIGDILVQENGAYIIVLEEIEDYLLSNYNSCGHARLMVERVEFSEIEVQEQEVIVRRVTVPSMRLDCVASSAYAMSRGHIGANIDGGKLFVNGVQILKKDYKLSEGDKLVIRGKGKAVLKSIGGHSKKDRIFIEIETYKS